MGGYPSINQEYSTMFQSIFNAIIALMGAVTTSAGAANKLAKAADNLCTVAEETSQHYLNETRINNQAKLNQLQADTGVKLVASA